MKAKLGPGKVDRIKWITVIFLCAVICAVLVFSGYYLAREPDHDCDGEECPVCECIALCQSYLRQLGNSAEAVGAVCIALLVWETVRKQRMISVNETEVSKYEIYEKRHEEQKKTHVVCCLYGTRSACGKSGRMQHGRRWYR